MIERLEEDGYPVIAPANPLRSLTSDAAYIHSVLESIKGPVVLVGHSYGGAVITNAAASDPNVKALVYVAAFVPDVGQRAHAHYITVPGASHAVMISHPGTVSQLIEQAADATS